MVPVVLVATGQRPIVVQEREIVSNSCSSKGL